MSDRDLKKAVEKYAEFHSFDEKRIISGALKIPGQIYCAGKGVLVQYASDKWEKKVNYYEHKHDSGVKVYRPDYREGRLVNVPAFIQNATCLVKLGACLRFDYVDPKGEEVVASCARPYPELYCTSNGKALLVIENKKRIRAIIWGGKLDVKGVGIVG